ncbi:MAG: hypothetical protein ACJ742_17885 [Actinomycetes bacterium]
MSDAAHALALPEEPVELRRRTRALIEQDPERGTAVVDAGSWIADPLWERWGPALKAAGMDRDRFGGIVTGYRRELWLWVMGERTWAQSAGGLLGRVQRRLPARKHGHG